MSETEKLPRAYVDKERPGIVRFEGTDSMDGILAGTRAAAVARRWNAYDDLREALTELLKHAGIADADPSDIDGEDHIRESKARVALSKAGA